MPRVIRLPAILALLSLTALARADDDDRLVPSITVVGQGEVQVQPDMATVTLGVTTEAANAADAVKANNDRMAQLLKALRVFDVADKHVQTSNFNVSPKHSVDRDRREPPRIVGYTVSNQVQVKIMELSRLGAILDAAVSAGGNTIHGVAFSLAEPGPHLDQARRKAMADALARAELYAAAAGVKLGAPLVISEQSPPGVPRFALGARVAMAEAAVPIATGEETIAAHVNVTYAISD
jgi:uncharacterized protein YggE